MTTKVTVANRSKVITKSTFNGYDACINPYVGCQFGCSYCYVRFFVKDDTKEWGEFLRTRNHIATALTRELDKGWVRMPDKRVPRYDEESGLPMLDKNGKQLTRQAYKTMHISDIRLVLGTMTDPYQPHERKAKLTRTVLEILTAQDNPKFRKVGIFTRSPLVTHDIDLIKQLPQARVHFTITPFPRSIMRAIEPISPMSERRWDTVRKLKAAGIRTHVNVSPIMPGMSEPMIEEWTRLLAEIGVDEYFVDPMQSYADSFEAFRRACQNSTDVNWPQVEAIMTDKKRYLEWKTDFFTRWDAARRKHQHLVPNQLPIWSDHENRTWIDMRTNTPMDRRNYGD